MTTVAHSYSRLSCFEQCETKYERLYVLRDVADKGSVHTEYGTRVHELLEQYARAVMEGTQAAEEMLSDGEATKEIRDHLPLVRRILSQPGDKYFEHQMALDRNKQPCDWFSKDVWLRGIADVLIVNGKRAFAGDWKTGKVKENPTQLKLFACMVLEMFPEVETVSTAFLWIAHGEVTADSYHRRDLADMWATLEPRFDAVQTAVNIGVFKSKPSPLCNWCPAQDTCPDKRRR